MVLGNNWLREHCANLDYKGHGSLTVKKGAGSVKILPEKAVFQMNDTHPTIAVAEVMRLLVDVEGLTWEHAWTITTKVRRMHG